MSQSKYPYSRYSSYSTTEEPNPVQTDLSELIRSHIAHRRRLKQLTHLDNNGSGTPILTGVKRVTELRQTPYRRFPTNSSSFTPRFLASPPPPPVLISEPTNNVEGEERYYVTYSPHNRIYQVSRRPPPYLYNIQTDRLPDSTDFAAPVTTIPVTQAPIGESVGLSSQTRFNPQLEQIIKMKPKQRKKKKFYRPQEEEEYEDVKESSTPSSAILIKWTASTSPSSTPLPPTTASTTEIPTTTVPPPIFIIQRGEALPINTPANNK
uniref:Uncharacterized protein n=1 Tax=Ditylenchus dipsaci TaxID=166011 RepID=A0A915E9Q5_9BILA